MALLKAQITELEAVNLGLVSAGATPVTSIDNTQPDVLSLKQLLTASSRTLQKRGWWFNREYAVVLAPDPQGRIVVPQNALVVDSTDRTDDFTVRGTFFYDRANSTLAISRSVTVDMISFLNWDELPFHAQEVIQYQAAMRFVGGDDGDADEFVRLRNEYDNAVAELKRVDLLAEDITVRSNLTVSRVMGRRTNRITTRFGGAAR